mgnify:CR=1 FL=1
MPVLLVSITSPFTRTCRVVAHEQQVDLTLQEVFPLDDDPVLLQHNPIGKVPALVRAGKPPLIDSRAICAHLDPRERTDRDIWLESAAHGVMEAALAIVMERRRRDDERSFAWMDRQEERLMRLLETLDGALPEARDTIGACALGCAVDYVDFRLSDLRWRGLTTQSLDGWLREQLRRDAMEETAYGLAV